MKDRIIEFLREKNLTSTKFADAIGVQRSSISHILSGRNKPSFDFIEKMLVAYPGLNAQWLITGKGSMFINEPDPIKQVNNSVDLFSQRESHIQNSNMQEPEVSKSGEELKEKSENLSINQFEEAEIDKIVIFYKDGTFKHFKPK